MPTLLLKLVAPMQSWGVQSHFTHRDTGFEPSKSGVIGLICAALGRGREDRIDDLAALKMGVRVDRQGVVLKDYHTAKNVLKAGGGIKETELSERFYLADAAFLVGLEGKEEDRPLLEEIQRHLREPIWTLFLGRKAFPASESLWIPHPADRRRPDGIRELSLRNALIAGYPRIRQAATADERVRIIIESEDGEILRQDQPISFGKDIRRFTTRRMTMDFVSLTPNAMEA